MGGWDSGPSDLPPCAPQISIQLKEVTCLKKEKTAKLIPNAIQICTENEKVSWEEPHLPLQNPHAPSSVVQPCPT